MKSKLLFLFVLVTIFSCSSDSDESNDPNPETQECGTVSLNSVVQNGNTINFDFQSSGTFNYFEVGYENTSNLSNQDPNSEFFYFNNNFITTNSSSDSFVDESLYYYAENDSSLSFYIRAQCQNGDLTSWFGPIILSLDTFCQEPYSLNVYEDNLNWSYSSNDTNASYFQVEYGLQGFAQGTGTVETTNYSSLNDIPMSQGSTYDFYVRAYCDNNLGFSNWVGPISTYASQDYNLCNLPSNVMHSVEYISGDTAGVKFEWDFNGEDLFECTVVIANGDPNSATITTIDGSGWPVYTGVSIYLNYDFYVRAVCSDGSRTEWLGPYSFSI